jgi:hypothetical protein
MRPSSVLTYGKYVRLGYDQLSATIKDTRERQSMTQLAALKNRIVGIRFPWKKKQNPYLLNIPTEAETSTDFTNRAAGLLADPRTRVYIDTSFLMWLTKIGSSSRLQFFQWIDATCPSQVCVPVWAAHEYLRHHVTGTIVDELDLKAKEMADVAGKTYHYLRPFLDSSLGPGIATAESQQVAARKALNDLEELSEVAKRWRSRYREHANEVIGFINERVPSRTDVFTMLDGITALGEDRFDSRVPPGHQDRNKKPKLTSGVGSGSDAEHLVGSNRTGDLIFWKEVLNLASTDRARNVIILTNDQKNDWQLGGRESPNEADLRDMKSKWRPLPLAHPMLCLEANIEAQVQHVMLLDTVYLGVLLQRTATEKTKSFVDVAIVPDPLGILTEQESRKAKARAYKAEEAALNAPPADESGPFRFEDNLQLVDSHPAMYRAWIGTKKSLTAGSPVATLLENIQEAVINSRSVADLLTRENVGGFDNGMLVALGRSLHDQCVAGTLGNPEALTDLLSILKTLPPKTASNLFLGFLGSMYFDHEKNAARLPPASPVSELIFDLQKSRLAAIPIGVIRKAFTAAAQHPLYLPNIDTPAVEITLDHVPDADGELILGSVMIAGTEVFSAAQKDPILNLMTVFGGRTAVSGKEILEMACNRFAIPLKQANYVGDPETEYSISPTAGFRHPKSIFTAN